MSESNPTFCAYTSSKTVHTSRWLQFRGSAPPGVPVAGASMVGVEVNSQLRIDLLGFMRPSVDLAERWMLENGDDEPISALFLVGIALVGGRQNAVAAPGNLCKVLLRLAFDCHWAPPPDWIFDQNQLAAWPVVQGWQEIFAQGLSRESAVLMLGLHTDISESASRQPPECFAGPSWAMLQTESWEGIRMSDFEGTVSETHVTAAGAKTTYCINLMTQGQFSKSKGEYELLAGQQLAAALAPYGSGPNAMVTRSNEEPADVIITQGSRKWRVQHTKADSRPYRKLAGRGDESRWFSVSEDREQLFAVLDSAVRKKANHYPESLRRDLILLLDLMPPRLPTQAIEAYKESRQKFFTGCAFQSIWLVSGFDVPPVCLYESN